MRLGRLVAGLSFRFLARIIPQFDAILKIRKRNSSFSKGANSILDYAGDMLFGSLKIVS